MYRYVRFNTYTLPIYEPEDPPDMGGYKGNYTAISGGGVFDQHGTGRPPRTERRITRKGRTIHDNVLDARHEIEVLATLAGTKGQLFRENEVNTRMEWAVARIFPQPEDRNPHRLYRYQNWWATDITLTFDVLSKCWFGALHSGTPLLWDSGVLWDSGATWDETGTEVYALSAGSNSIVFPNLGNAQVDNAIFTVTAGSSAVTALRFVCAAVGVDFTWDSAQPGQSVIAVGESLVLDMGQQTVKNDGVGAYGGIIRNAGYTIDPPIAAPIAANGGSTYTVTLTGGGTGTVLSPSYAECWN